MLRQVQTGYLRELAPHIKASLLLLSMGAVVGSLSAAHFFTIDSGFSDSLRSFTQMFTGLPRPLLAVAIFLNNATKTLLVLILGIIGGVLPICFLLLNGYALGFVLYLSIQSKGLGPSLLAIVPHGMFELPAVLLGASIGIFLGVRAIRRLFGKFEPPLRNDVGRGLSFFWSIILPLLLFAAFIEAFVTSALVSK
jgi:stage II sporulation protein M